MTWKRIMGKLALLAGYQNVNWTRVIMNRESRRMIQQIEPAKQNVLEISGEGWKKFGFASYRSVQFPEFDICEHTLPEKFSLIIAEQVFEHVSYPYRAVKNVYSMLKEGGYFYLSVPFVYPIHEAPQDCTRWSQLGIKYLLQEAGFPESGIQTNSWGNRQIVRMLVSRWMRRPLLYNQYIHSLKNEDKFPVVVWALAKKGN